MRPWRDVSIVKKLYLVIGTMAVLIACELLTLRFAMGTLSAVRAFVAGEGSWSKGQKDAALALQSYALTGAEADYQAFLDNLRVPEGDHRARIELEKPRYDMAVVREGFIAGHIHPDDIQAMVDLLRRFHGQRHIAGALAIWRRGDELLVQFKAAGIAYHDALLRSPRETTEIHAALARVNGLNGELTTLEDGFSGILGEGSRWLENAVNSLLFLAVLFVETIGLTLTLRTTRSISRGLAAANQAAARIGQGDFSTKLAVSSQDELGQLAGSINRTGTVLERSYRELEERVDQRTAELTAMANENQRLYVEASDAVRMRDEFISVASHELKTPLTALNLQLELLARRVQTAVSDEAQRAKMASLVESSLRQSRRLGLLTTELMDLTRIRVGRLDIRREACDLSAVVREVSLSLGHEAARAGSPLDLDAHAPVEGWWDPARMGQVVTNLISNAIKYGGGQPIRVAVERAGDVARFAVQDRGIGVAPEHQGRIFERFERSGAEASRVPGLGLGLYIARQIVELHGGRIELQSTLGSGSTFTVELPLSR